MTITKRPQNILISVLGSSPAVITETLYALRNSDSFPQSIIIYTTNHGQKQFFERGAATQIAKLCNSYQLPLINEQNITIRVVANAAGETLEDLRSEADQEAMADFLTQEIRQLTQQDNTRIHASIAGGRKSMSFYMGYIFSMFAREHDTLSHVLVSEPFETIPDFWFPTTTAQTSLITWGKREGQEVNHQDAIVELAEIPFVRLNQVINSEVINQASQTEDSGHPQMNKYSDWIAAYQLSFAPENIQLTLDTQQHHIKLNGKILNLTIEAYALYRMVIKQTCQPKLDWQTDQLKGGELGLESHFLAIIAQVVGYKQRDPEGILIDELDRLREHYKIKIGKIPSVNTYNGLEEKGFTIKMYNGLQGQIKKALQQVAVGDTVKFCSVSSVKQKIEPEAVEARKSTKGGYIGLSLNPNQITII